MSTGIPMTLRVREKAQTRVSTTRVADRALDNTTRLWFVTTVLGQVLFAVTVATFYGSAVARGDLTMWNRFMFRGHIAGDAPGNFAVAVHLASAVVMILAGALQFVPQIRARFPALHRWSGRLYILTVFTLSIAGVYMHWFRGAFGDLSQHVAGTLNAVLIWVCAVFALRYAMARDLARHRRWALRLFLVVSASYFFRIAFFLVLLVFKGPVGFDPATFRGPLLTFLSFAVYLFPLAVVELYFLARKGAGSVRRLAMAAMLVVFTLATAAGTLTVSGAIWVPAMKSALDSRRSIALALSATIQSAGIERAVQQYRQIKAAAPPNWNLDEAELNRLGYQLLRTNRITDAIRIFRLNAEAYPRSSNTWDSLAEGYLRAGNKRMAAAHYRRAVSLNPKNRNAIAALHQLGAP